MCWSFIPFLEHASPVLTRGQGWGAARWVGTGMGARHWGRGLLRSPQPHPWQQRPCDRTGGILAP